MLTSYAQNFEDVILFRLLGHISSGFYIDVGANDPDLMSVTRAFYERGWRGINIEPSTEFYTKLVQRRDCDINIQAAVSTQNGTIPFFEIPETGLSSTRRSWAERARHSHGRLYQETRTHTVTLDTVIKEHAPRDIHFLKIDAEGQEFNILQTIRLDTYRPWVIVLEIFGNEDTQDDIHHLLSVQHYTLQYFDGLNRFYIRAESVDQLCPHGINPPGVFDQFQSARESQLAHEIFQLKKQLELIQSTFHPKLKSIKPKIALKPFVPQADDTVSQEPPTLARLGSQLCTINQFSEPAYTAWCQWIKEAPNQQRKQWEFVFILETLKQHQLLKPGMSGLGFGCGTEPLPAVMALHGCQVLATDLDTESAQGSGWIETQQHAHSLFDLNSKGICPPDIFAQRVRFQAQNMNQIDKHLTGFDFVWSSCALEHLGSIQHGIDFILNACHCLKPGGLAVHTTEYNVTSNDRTLQHHNLCLYRRKDIEHLQMELRRINCVLTPVNFNHGTHRVDASYDVPPYHNSTSLKIQIDEYVTTSIGLVITKLSH